MELLGPISLHVQFPDQNSEFRRSVQHLNETNLTLNFKATFSSPLDVAYYEQSFTTQIFQFIGGPHLVWDTVEPMLAAVHVPTPAPIYLLQKILAAVADLIMSDLSRWDPRITFDLALTVNELPREGLTSSSWSPLISVDQEEQDEEEEEEELDILFNDAQRGGELGFVPASREGIEGLERVVVKGELESCCVCLEEFLEGSEETRMPCQHCFHTDCIVEWLEKSGVCPLCRFQIT